MAEQKSSDKLKDLKARLRSLVVSNPAKMKIDNLRRDYKEFVGGNIPISDFGYGNLVRFIKEECGDVFQVEGDPFNPTLCPIITKEIEELDRFISRQKTPLNKSHTVKRSRVIESKNLERENERPRNYNSDFQTNNRRNPTQDRNNEYNDRGSDPPRRRNGNSYRSSEPSYRNNETDSESEPVYIRNASSYRGNKTYRENETYNRRSETSYREDTLRRAGESHKRDTSYRLKEPSQRGIEPRQMANESYTENNKQIHGNNPSSPERKNHNHHANIPLPEETVQKVSQKFSQKLIDNMRNLVDQFPEGLWSCNLLDEYFKLYNKTLNLTILDYNSVIALCKDMPETFHITRPQASGDWKLFGWNADIPRIEAAEHVRKVDVTLADKEAEAENDYMGNDALPGIDYHPSLYPNDCMSWTEALPVLEQRQKETLEVHITEVRDPSHFWYNIRGPEHSDALDTLMDNLDNTYRMTNLSEPLKMPRPIARIGQYCVSRYGDNFHRALIVADVDVDTVKVRYVDYGTVHTVQANNLFHLLSKFAHLPQQGLRGRLMNLKPVLGAASWSQSARRRFLTLVKEKVLIGKIIKFDTEENVAVMGLVNTAGIKDIHINDVLYNERLADLIAEVEGEHNPDVSTARSRDDSCYEAVLKWRNDMARKLANPNSPRRGFKHFTPKVRASYDEVDSDASSWTDYITDEYCSSSD